MEKSKIFGDLANLLKKPGFWFILILLVLITIPYYSENIRHPYFIDEIIAGLGLSWYAFERILYLLPIIYAGFIFGWLGTIVTSFLSLSLMLPGVFMVVPFSGESLFETFAVFTVGNAVAITFVALRKEREHRIQISILDQIVAAISRSLDLHQVLNASVDTVINVMKIDAALIFLYDKDGGELNLASYKGVSETFVEDTNKLKLGEGLNGVVALTGEPEYIEDALSDTRLTKVEAIRFENLHSYFIVPLKSRNKVMGTLCMATRNKYHFKKAERGTAIAIGNEIGVAIENAWIYEKQREIAEQLRESEEKYRNLFENAHDAIWLHDMKDNIIAVNRACTRLTGYNKVELYDLKARELLSPDGLPIAENIKASLLNSKDTGSISELKIIKKDKTEVIVQLASSLVLSNEQPWAFQHIARDISQEKRMQENLQFYLQKVTQAQEEERKRIALELHDDTIQSLVVLARNIDDFSDSSAELSEDKKLILEKIREETKNIMSGIRRLSQDLRPPILDRLGLIPALESLATSIEDISGIKIRFNIAGMERRLPSEAELILYRIIQETLRNIWRHSGATMAEVSVQFVENQTKLVVKDNGKGMESTSQLDDLARYGKLGLAGIRERAKLLGGTMRIESVPGHGTTIFVEAPV